MIKKILILTSVMSFAASLSAASDLTLNEPDERLQETTEPQTLRHRRQPPSDNLGRTLETLQQVHQAYSTAAELGLAPPPEELASKAGSALSWVGSKLINVTYTARGYTVTRQENYLIKIVPSSACLRTLYYLSCGLLGSLRQEVRGWADIATKAGSSDIIIRSELE